MRSLLVRAAVGVCLWSSVGFSQSRSNVSAGHHRILCVVPMTGAGTVQDPRRPLWTPVAAQLHGRPKPNPLGGYQATVDDSLLSYQSVLTDDGQSAIVMFTVSGQAAAAALRNQQGIFVLFDSQSSKAVEILPVLRRFKRDFNLQMLLQEGAR